MVSPYRRNSRTGFTLIELLVVIAIVAILTSLAVPSISSFIDNEKVSATRSELSSSLTLARSAAIKARVPVVLCASNTGSSCGKSWSAGWVGFQDDDRDGTRDSSEALILVHQGDSDSVQVTVESATGKSVSAVSFNYRGKPDSALQVTLERSDANRSFSVTPFGKTRSHD